MNNDGLLIIAGHHCISKSLAGCFSYSDFNCSGVQQMTGNALKGKAAIGKESVHMRKDGSLFPVAVTKSPISDDNGKVIAISNTIQNITRLKEREKVRPRRPPILKPNTGIITPILLASLHKKSVRNAGSGQ